MFFYNVKSNFRTCPDLSVYNLKSNTIRYLPRLLLWYYSRQAKRMLDISTLRLTQPNLVELGIGLSLAKIMALIAIYNSRATGKLLPVQTNTVAKCVTTPIPITFFFWVIILQMPHVLVFKLYIAIKISGHVRFFTLTL